ncbi:exported hypothetical protein [Candidatus Magnetomoraceae bacterium gMMP-13]
MKKLTSCIIFIILSIFIISPASAFNLPDTGQTKCYDNEKEIPCPQPGEDFYGQDANYTINPMSFTKLDANGNDLPDSASSWAMVRDNNTGLIWEVKQNQDYNSDYSNPHDADNKYAWYDSNPENNGGDTGYHYRNNTEEFINSLNSENFGGFSDWRLPTKEELRSIFDYGGVPSPTINTDYFPNTAVYTVFRCNWSSDAHANNAGKAWCMNINAAGGYDISFYKSTHNLVRAVRGGQSESYDNFVINGDGTITDTKTGLMWQQATAPNKMNWKDALAYCENLTLAGYSDWRLPDIKELASIVDLTRYMPAIDINYFPDTVSDFYWSSVSNDQDGYYSVSSTWVVKFNYGGYEGWLEKWASYYVRAVRSGESESYDNLVIWPFYPTSNYTPSQIMHGGKAVRCYRIFDENNNPITNKTLHYRFYGYAEIFSANIDDQGFVKIETPNVTSDSYFSLILTDASGNDLENVNNLPIFQVNVQDREFTESYKILFKSGITYGVGLGTKIGPIKLKAAEASLNGGKKVATQIEYSTVGNNTELTVENMLGHELGGELSAGLFGKTWGTKMLPDVEVGAKIEVKSGLELVTRHTFPDFFDNSQSSHDAQLLASAGLFFENAVNSVGIIPGMDTILHAVINRITNIDDYKQGLGTTFSLAGAGSFGVDIELKNPLGVSAGSLAELNLSAFDGEYVYERTGEENVDGTTSTTQAVTTNLDLGTLQLSVAQKFAGVNRRKDTPKFDLTNLIDASIYTTEGEQSLSIENHFDGSQEIEYKQLVNREGGDSYFFTSTIEDEFACFKVENAPNIDEIAQNADLVQNMLNGDSVDFMPSAYEEVYDAILNIQSGWAEWEKTKNETILISIPFDLEGALGVKLGINLNLDMISKLEYTTMKGLILPEQGMFETEIYEKDQYITDYKKGVFALLNEYTEALKEVALSVIDTVEGVVEAGKDFVVETAEQVGADVKVASGYLADKTKVFISKIIPQKRSYRIKTRSGTTEVAAATIGDVFIVNVTDPDGNYIEEFNPPLELTIDYTDEMLQAARFLPEDASKLNIYRWNGTIGYYTFMQSTVDTANKTVTCNISLPGQYLLAIDEAAPEITNFSVSDSTPTPTINFSVNDSLSGVDLESIYFEIDSTEIVNISNYTNYFNPATGFFNYEFNTALASGEHALTFTAQDSAGNSFSQSYTFTVNDVPPEIHHSPITQTSAGASLSISATATDDEEIKGVFLFYRSNIDELPYLITEMHTANSENSYSATISKEDITASGIQYFIKAIDSAGNETEIQAIDITVNDTTGPEIEGEIIASLEASGIKIKWNPSKDTDSAGYNVYVGDTAESLELIEDVGNTTWALLENPNKNIYVAIAAYDQSGNEGKKTDPVKIQALAEIPGDINVDNQIDLSDAVISLQICAGMPPLGFVSKSADVNGNGKIDLVEIIYILQRISGMK